MTQARMGGTCGHNCLAAGHEAVKKKPKTAVARGLCNSHTQEVSQGSFFYATKEDLLQLGPNLEAILCLKSQELRTSPCHSVTHSQAAEPGWEQRLQLSHTLHLRGGSKTSSETEKDLAITHQHKL
jgi:hypothetical protein